MSTPKDMAPLRRRAMPGMSTTAPHDPPWPPDPSSPAGESSPRQSPTGSEPTHRATSEDRRRPSGRRRAKDYAATRPVNFRLPVDLHDRYRLLVAEVAQQHPRWRRASLTEVIIGLLEEGPSSVNEVAAVIRRKRASEILEDGP